jgi:hypothetical protein
MINGGGRLDITALQNDLAALQRDVGRLLEHLKSGAATGFQGAAEQIEARVADIYRDMAVEGERVGRELSRRVEERPLITLLIVLGLGYIGGRLFSR